VFNPLIATSVLLAVGAGFDGKSTIDFLTKGKGAFVEADKILVWLYRTDTPSNKQVILGGGAIIAAEIAIAFVASHFWHPAAWVFMAQQVVQAGVHFYEYHRNEANLAAYLKTKP
jgi:hypothetical protein